MLFQIFPCRRAVAQQNFSMTTFPQTISQPNPCPSPFPSGTIPGSAPQAFGCTNSLVPPLDLGAPAGKNHGSAAEAAAFANKIEQGKGFSTKLEQVYTDRCYREAEQKYFNLSYKDGSPRLSEIKKDQSMVDSKFEVLFFADGKIYNAKGEAQGRFLLDANPVAGQEKSPLLFCRGTLERTGNISREEYDPASMTLGGKKVFIVNGAPPGTEAVLKQVVAVEVEGRKTGNGLILHNPKAIGYEVDWVSPKIAAETREQILTKAKDEIARLNLSKDKEGVWTLSDGTKVGAEEGRYFVVRETVLPTKHPLGRAELAYGRTGLTQREFIGGAGTPKAATPDPIPQQPPMPMPPPLPEPKATPAPMPEPKGNPNPAPAPAPEPKATPSPQPKIGEPSKEPTKEAPENLAKHHPGIREHQLRMMQWTEAVVVAFERLAIDPKEDVPEVVLKVKADSLKSPSDYAKFLDSWAVQRLDELDKKYGNSSIRFADFMNSVHNAKSTLEKMPAEASPGDISKVFRNLRGEIFQSSSVFCREFGFGHYYGGRILGISDQKNIEKLISENIIVRDVDVDGRAKPISEYLLKHQPKED